MPFNAHELNCSVIFYQKNWRCFRRIFFPITSRTSQYEPAARAKELHAGLRPRSISNPNANPPRCKSHARFLNRRFAQLRPELEQGNPSPCAFGLVLKTVLAALRSTPLRKRLIPARCASKGVERQPPAPKALAYRSPIPLVTIACEAFTLLIRED